MRIAYLVNQYPKVSHSFIRREIAALESLGHKVDRYSIRRTEGLVDGEDQQEATRTAVVLRGFWSLMAAVTWLKLTHPIRWIRACLTAMGMGWRSDRGVLRHLIYLMEAARLVVDLRNQPVDHLHVHFGTNSATVGLLAGMLGGPSWSFTVHGPEDFDKVAAIALPKKLEEAQGVVAISSYCRSQLMRWMPVQGWERVAEVHCGLDALFLEAEVTPLPDRPRLVCVGRLCEQKGQLLLLEAVAQVRERGQDVELVLAGDGEMRGIIEQRVEELSLQDVVRITGWIDGKRVRAEIESSRALVLPSFAEGLPVVLMEAMALARPVVSTYIAGIPELVKHRENGWLVPAGDVTALADALLELLRCDDGSLAEMGRRGREAVLDRHDAKKEAEVLAAAFARCRERSRA